MHEASGYSMLTVRRTAPCVYAAADYSMLTVRTEPAVHEAADYSMLTVRRTESHMHAAHSASQLSFFSLQFGTPSSGNGPTHS